MPDRLTIMVTGANGQLGRDCVTVATAAGHHVVGCDRASCDVTNPDIVREAVAAARPDLIFNCAAWTNVDGAEDNPQAAMAVNGTGAHNIVAAAAEHAIPVIHVSTDYVFSGSKEDGYLEDDPREPINAYGRSKAAGEDAIMAYEHGCVVRTSWLFGLHGENFVHTMVKLGKKLDRVEVVDDQTGCPTWTVHLAHAMLEIAHLDQLPKVVHRVGSPEVTWYGFAQQIMQIAGLTCVVDPTTSAAFPRPAARPAHSTLLSTNPDLADTVGDWREGVAAICGAPISTSQ